MWTKDGDFILDEREAFAPQYPPLKDVKEKERVEALVKEPVIGKIGAKEEKILRAERR